jgi:hypothetical protein
MRVTWKHSAIRFVTPAACHSGKEEAILNNRKVVYEVAKQRNPQRCSGETRNWELVGIVWLNPDKPDASGVEIRHRCLANATTILTFGHLS